MQPPLLKIGANISVVSPGSSGSFALDIIIAAKDSRCAPSYDLGNQLTEQMCVTTIVGGSSVVPFFVVTNL